MVSRLKLLVVLIASVCLITGLPGLIGAEAGTTTNNPAGVAEVKVLMNGQQMNFLDGIPYLDLETGQVYVPLRHISEALGAVVDWKLDKNAAVVYFGGRIIEMTAGQNEPLVNNRPGLQVGAPVRLEDNRMMVPLGFVSEILESAVDWAERESTVKIKTPGGDRNKPGAITVTEQVVQSAAEGIEVDMHIPVLSGFLDGALEREINTEFVEKAEAFRLEIAEPFAEYKKAMEYYGGPVHPFQAVTAYDVHYNQDGLLSISVSYYGYQGGAHGFTIRETLNLDVNTGERLTLANFFKPEEEGRTVVVQRIQEEIATNPEAYFEHALGEVGKITDDQPFYIEEGQIVVYFAQYEIAPYAAGMPEFAIPWVREVF